MAKNLDDILSKFQKEAEKAQSSNRKFWNGTEEDKAYEVDIHIWRKEGMGNSLQTVAGNKISIMTATMSYLETLVSKEVITMRELDYMINTVKEVLQKKGRK